MEQSYISRTSGIKAKDKIGYAMGDLASCLVFGLTQSVLNKYYTDVLEISVLSVMIMTNASANANCFFIVILYMLMHRQGIGLAG